MMSIPFLEGAALPIPTVTGTATEYQPIPPLALTSDLIIVAIILLIFLLLYSIFYLKDDIKDGEILKKIDIVAGNKVNRLYRIHLVALEMKLVEKEESKA